MTSRGLGRGRLALIGVLALGAAALAGLGWINDAVLRLDADALPSRPVLARIAAIEAAPTYARHCAQCHGGDLRGDRRIGAPDLTDGDWIYGDGGVASLEQTITYGIRSGHPKTHNLADMPAFASARPYRREALNPLTPPQIEAVVEYLFELEGRAPLDAGKAREGAAIYAGAGGCYDCHSGDGGGDTFVGAVNLRARIWLYGDGSRAALFQSIAKGRAGVCPAWISRLSPQAIRRLAVFIYLRSHPSKGA